MVGGWDPTTSIPTPSLHMQASTWMRCLPEPDVDHTTPIGPHGSAARKRTSHDHKSQPSNLPVEVRSMSGSGKARKTRKTIKHDVMALDQAQLYLAPALVVAYYAIQSIYRVHFHPLSKILGLKYPSLSLLPVMDKTPHRNVRSACDACHGFKIRCSGGEPCSGCTRSGQPCTYSEPNRVGRPRGSKNKKTPGVDKSKSDRSRNKTIEMAANVGARSNKTVPTMLLDRHASLGNETCSPSWIERWNDLAKENSLTDLDENSFLNNISTSDFSWEQPSDVVGTETGIRGYEPDLSNFSLGTSPPDVNAREDYEEPYPDTHRPSMTQIGNIPFTELNNCVAQDTPLPIPDVFPRSRSETQSFNNIKACACVKQHTRFLSHLRNIKGNHYIASLPTILQATQDSRFLWQQLVNCAACRHDRECVAVLMFAMGLRTIVQYIQALVSGQQLVLPQPLYRSRWGQHAPSVLGSGPSSGTPHPGSTGNGRSVTFEPASNDITRRRRSSSISTNTIRVGNFEVPEDEQVFLVTVLIMRTLDKIQTTYDAMVGYIGQVRGTSPLNIGTGEKRQIHYVLDDLRILVTTTEGFVREFANK